MRRALILSILVWLVPLSALAQDAPASAQRGTGQSGPMTVERIHSGFVIAPDVKATELDRRVEPLIGLFGGWQIDQTFLVGVGGYWLATDRENDRRMGYGGLVVQWLGNRGGRFGYGAKALLGGGEATFTETVAIPVPAVRAPNGTILRPATTITDRERFRRDFALAEPELLGVVRLSRNVRLTGGVGYRFAGSDSRRDEFDNFHLNGATASVALQIGGGS
jgi:hypothetical protein